MQLVTIYIPEHISIHCTQSCMTTKRLTYMVQIKIYP